MRAHKVIFFASQEQSRHEARLDVVDWVYIENVETRPALNRAPYHLQHRCFYELWHLDVRLDDFVDQVLEVAEGRVQDHPSYRGVSVPVEQSGGGAHRGAPQADVGNFAAPAEVIDNGLDVVSLEPAERDVITVREA